jgi:predicted phosphodiesterase
MNILSNKTTDHLRVAYHSDLHLERSKVELDTVGAHVTILAGDILETERVTRTKSNSVIDAIATKLVPDENIPVIFVPGNHDLVGNRWRDAIEIWKEISQKRYDGRIHVLVNESWIYEGVQFLGTPLWTDFSSNGTQLASMFAAKNWVCDFSTIHKEDGRLILPQDWLDEHKMARTFLDKHLRADQWVATDLDIPQVVVTHWCPSLAGVHGARFQANKVLAPFWVSSDDDLVARSNTWIFGHTHKCVDLRVGYDDNRGRLLSNARGSFALDNEADKDWKRNAVLEIKQPNSLASSLPECFGKPKP